MQTFEQQYKSLLLWVLYIESSLDKYGLDLSKMGPLLCRGTELHITKAVDYTDLFIGKKKNDSKSKIKD